MAEPIERFKSGPANHRWNPFTDADMAIDKTEDDLYIPSSMPFVLQLLEVPRKDTPSSVAIYNYDDGGYMTEVETSPTQGQFRVDYPAPDGEGTGLVEFNSNDNGKRIRVEYKATGSPVVVEFFDSKISGPAGSPGENQVAQKKSAGWIWAYNPIQLFHSENVLYHPNGESKSCLLFRFKKGSNASKVFLELMGAEVHQGFYTELKEHNHAVDLGTDSPGGHGHDSGSLSGSQSWHSHTYWATQAGALETSYDGNEGVTISGSTGSAGNHAHWVGGSTALTGGSPKTYPDQLKVYIDGVDKTANILTLSGLDKLGDGTETHTFVTTGTGEMDITAMSASLGA